MVDILITIFQLVFTLVCFVSPFVIVGVIIFLVIKKKNKTETSQNTLQTKNTHGVPIYHSATNQQPVQQSPIEHEVYKDEIDEFYENTICPYRAKY